MNILHVIHRFLPEGVVGGTTTYLRDLAMAQQEEHNVLIFCGGPPRNDGPLVDHVEIDGLAIAKIHHVDQHWHWQSSSPNVNSAFTDVLTSFKPDVVHFHSIVLLSLDLPMLAKQRSVPTVYTLHDQYFVCARGFPAQPTAAGYQACYARGGLKCFQCANALLKPASKINMLWHTSFARPRAMAKTFSHIDRFIAPSQWIAGYYESNGFPSDRVSICGYGLNTEPFNSTEKTTAEHVRFAYLGGGHPAKGLLTLLEAFANTEGTARLTIFGDYDDDLMKKHASERVHFGGTLFPKDKPQAFKDIDVVVVPSQFPDNSPLVIHEARASATPVIGTRIGGIPELVEEQKTGFLVEPADVTGLRTHLQNFIANPQSAYAMGNRIEPIKTIEQHLDEMERLYEEAGSYDLQNATLMK